jgi:hypothetical protein
MLGREETMNRLVSLIAMSLVTCQVCTAFADDDLITKRLDDAKSTFEQEQTKLRDDLTGVLKKKADDAKKAGDLKLLERARAEADAWDTKGELPKIVSTRSYEEGLKKTRMKMELAFTAAVKEYTKADNIERAKATEAELYEFKNGRASTPAAISPQPLKDGPTKQKLREFLENTTWQPPDAKFWFRLNADGTVTPGWHSNNACLWTVSSTSTIKVQADSERHVQDLEVDMKNGTMKDKRPNEPTYKRIK